ncbi:cold shock domain-containing protein [Lysobacter niastensis]|uniref:Excalibur calcium-binding domain-containing protein n=1 Tax=Lysobacter niastensis TaxID=380629 RepID=A0ABS0B874_9GAMM|nr:cold shock domain-containing protein [Lysobacter niastensis]MBF6025225.1 excalibur calcium-binding domain-containing protein [Lysobacter niastensis]
MRTHGTLTKWNDDRGFGFVSPAAGGSDVFVHISAFPRDGERPHLNELISFETEAGPNGQPRAVRVMRAGQPAKAGRQQRASGRSTRRIGLVEACALAAIVAAGAYGYSRFTASHSTGDTMHAAVAAPAPAIQFHCDGRKHCSQMRSCAEATQYLQHCPGMEMDGDGDGVPCEQQWCY